MPHDPLDMEITGFPYDAFVLTEADIMLGPDLLERLLAIPRKALVGQLEHLIRLKMEELKWPGRYKPDEFGFFHALMLLGHLKASESMDLIMEVWRLPDPKWDLAFGDLFLEALWVVPLLCGEQHHTQLVNMIKDNAVDQYARVNLVDVFAQIALHEPYRKQEMINLFDGLLTHFVEKPDEQYTEQDCTVCGFIAETLSGMNAQACLPSLKLLFEEDRVELLEVENWHEYLHYFGEEDVPVRPIFQDVRDWYKTEGAKWHFIIKRNREAAEKTPFSFDKPALKEKLILNIKMYVPPPDQLPQNGHKTIQPNDPCPCGSGKKYKGCHGAPP